MPTVFLREGSRSFHRHEECPQLVKRPARGTQKQIIKIDLEQLTKPRPCRTCYTDAPRSKVVRRYCPLCNGKRTAPCAHNGGVRVTVAHKTNYVGLLRDPGDEVVQERWVWPDHLHWYEPSIAS